MNKLERDHTVDRERLYIKLLIFSLKRTKEFVLGRFDEELANSLNGRVIFQENFYMLTFCFRSLDPDFFEENFISPDLKDFYIKLIQKMKRITTSKSLYNFVKNDIDDSIVQLQSQFKKVSQ